MWAHEWGDMIQYGPNMGPHDTIWPKLGAIFLENLSSMTDYVVPLMEPHSIKWLNTRSHIFYKKPFYLYLPLWFQYRGDIVPRSFVTRHIPLLTLLQSILLLSLLSSLSLINSPPHPPLISHPLNYPPFSIVSHFLCSG